MKTFVLSSLLVGASASGVTFTEENLRIDTRTDLTTNIAHGGNSPQHQTEFNALNGLAASTVTRRGGLPDAPAGLSKETLKLDALKAAGARTCRTVTCKHEVHECASRTSPNQDDGVCGVDANGIRNRWSSVRVSHKCVGLKKTDAQMKVRACTEDICLSGHYCAMNRDSECDCVERKPYDAIPGCTDQWGDKCYKCDMPNNDGLVWELDADKSRCKLHGGWSEYSLWSTCTKSCGTGNQVNYRTCSNPEPQYGGDGCEGAEEDSQDCNVHDCPIDGNWGGWSPLEPCTVTGCGQTGTRTKTRTCTNPEPQFGGKDCSTELDDHTNSDATCATPCCAGTFSTTGSGVCATWKLCPIGMGRINTPSATLDRECKICDIGVTFSTANDGAACASVREPCPAGQHITAHATVSSDMTCGACESGFYTSEPGQVACKQWQTCGEGEGMITEGTSTADRQCGPCNGKTTFSNTDDGTACALVREPCPAGQHITAHATRQSDMTCGANDPGTFTSSEGQTTATTWKTCPAGEGQINTPSADTDRVCGPCTIAEHAGTFSGVDNGLPCTAADVCINGEYEKIAATLTTDRTCATHAAECQSHEYESQAPTKMLDRECSQKMCFCEFGVPAQGNDCPADDGTHTHPFCTGCNDGYHMENNVCVITPINGGWSDWGNLEGCSVSGACGQSGTRTKRRTCTNPAPQHGGNDCSALDGGSATNSDATCATASCYTFDWTMTAASCPSACGTAASTPANTYTCTRTTVADGATTTVSDAFCSSNKPSTTTSCAATASCYTFAWTKTAASCPVTCGYAASTPADTHTCTRTTVADGATTTVSDASCGSNKPSTTTSCAATASCDTYAWAKTAASCPTTCGTDASTPADTYTCARTTGADGPIYRWDRAQCGSNISDEASCTSQGCLWGELDLSYHDGARDPWCYHPFTSTCAVNGDARNDFSFSSPQPYTEDGAKYACEDAGGCWQPTNHGQNRPWCFSPQNTATVPAVTTTVSDASCSSNKPSTTTSCAATSLCPVNGAWSGWTAGSCSTTCGDGTKTSTRTCDGVAHGGDDCSGLDGGSATKTESCKIKECPIDGTWSTWSTWTACSKSCGPGTQTKTRTCDGRAHGGADCVGPTSKVGNCNLGSCVTYSWSKTAASCPTACGTAASSPADSYDCVGSDGSTGNAGSLCGTKPSTTTSCAATASCWTSGSQGCWNGSNGPSSWTNGGGIAYSSNPGSTVWYVNGNRMGGGYSSIVSQCTTACSNAGYNNMAIHDNTACFCSSLPVPSNPNSNCWQNKVWAVKQPNTSFTMKGCYNGSNGPAGWTNNGGAKYSCTKGSAVWYAHKPGTNSCGRYSGGYTSIVSQCKNTCKNAGYTSMAIHDNTACFCSNLPLGAPDKNNNCYANRVYTGL